MVFIEESSVQDGLSKARPTICVAGKNLFLVDLVFDVTESRVARPTLTTNHHPLTTIH